MVDREIPPLPAAATAEVTERHASGAEHEVAYLLDGEVVAARLYDDEGRIEQHSSRKDGVRHGGEYFWDPSGQLRSLTPYEDGLEHGTAYQWDPSGRELGTYQTRHGTGLDLWRAQRMDGSPYLAEARFMVSGERHGFEWILTASQTAVDRESRYAAGLEHGIFREWDDDGALAADFPAFYLLGRRVEADEYAAARSIDPHLPAYDPLEDQPGRHFPDLVRVHLRPPSSA